MAVASGSLGSAGIGDDREGVAAVAALHVFSVAHFAWMFAAELTAVGLVAVCEDALSGVWCA